MTDYLAELLENAGDLLEEVRRTEKRLAAPLFGEAAEGGTLQSAVRRSASLEKESGEMAEKVRETDSASGRAGDSPAGADLPEGKQAESPLLEQTLQMERVLQAAERAGAAERSAVFGEEGSGRGAFPLSLPGSGGKNGLPGERMGGVSGWLSGLAAETAAPGAAEEDWAERADRAFRRDSRRYDGGFYLY